MCNRKPLGVICAMECEAAQLIAALENKKKETIAGCDFYAGTLSGCPAVVVRCGIGKVNAARITQTMIDRYDPMGVINSGIAGGIGDGLRVGDVVIGARLVQHDFDATVFGRARGNVFDGDPAQPTFFCADEKLSAAMRRAAEKIADGRGIHVGVIASGDVFVAGAEIKRDLRETFGATAAEMEGAALAQTAQYAGVPFAVLRVLSDLADGSAPESYETFETAAADFSAEVIRAMARELGK